MLYTIRSSGGTDSHTCNIQISEAKHVIHSEMSEDFKSGVTSSQVVTPNAFWSQM